MQARVQQFLLVASALLVGFLLGTSIVSVNQLKTEDKSALLAGTLYPSESDNGRLRQEAARSQQSTPEEFKEPSMSIQNATTTTREIGKTELTQIPTSSPTKATATRGDREPIALTQTPTSSPNTSTTSQDAAASDPMSDQLRIYDDNQAIIRNRAMLHPANSIQRRLTISKLPSFVTGDDFYAVEAVLQPWKKKQIRITLLDDPNLQTHSKYFNIPPFRRPPTKRIPKLGDRRTEFVIRDCRVVSLLDGTVHGNNTNESIVKNDRTTLSSLRSEKKLNATLPDPEQNPMIPCGVCAKYVPKVTHPDTSYKRKLWWIECGLHTWVNDIISAHAGEGVFQFDIGIVHRAGPKYKQTLPWYTGENTLQEYPMSVWPMIPGISLDVPLTSYNHNLFRHAPFKGDPVALYPTAEVVHERKLALCLCVSSPPQELLLRHTQKMFEAGVHHVFYLPTIPSILSTEKTVPKLTDPETYLSGFLEISRATQSLKKQGLVTMAASNHLPDFDTDSIKKQLISLEACYSRAMATGYDWVLVLDIDEMPRVIRSDDNIKRNGGIHGEESLENEIFSDVTEQHDPMDTCSINFNRFNYWPESNHKKIELQQLEQLNTTLKYEYFENEFSPYDKATYGKHIVGKKGSYIMVHSSHCEQAKKEIIVPVNETHLVHLKKLFSKINPET